ncbi:MAG: methyltransferase [Deltaproteobacteria bacterium]|nr:methyltransferase [Deltaproteobacteria bacterium]MBW2497880.1 methyltransferase [Deltaproteobacteria bacterium]
MIDDEVDLEAGCEALAEGAAPPYWAFCWGSGQALARYLLDRPEIVTGRSVVDLGCGSGVAGLAAARAGARKVMAVDLDPLARMATRLNAARNGLEIETPHELPTTWDLMLAADVLYETGLREWLLGEARTRGAILLGDPQRTGTPRLEQPELARFEARTLPDVDSPRTSVVLHFLPQLGEEPEGRLPRATSPTETGC